MQIATLATLNSAQSVNLRSKTQLSQDANSFENELEKANLAQQNLTTKSSQTQTSPNLNELDLSSENFFEDLVNAYYKETGDMLESMQFMVVEKFLALGQNGYAST